MKNKMTFLIFMGLLLSCFKPAMAQGKLDKLMTETTPEERAELQTKNMQDKLSLSKDQYQLVLDINGRYAQKMQRVYQTEQGKIKRLRAMRALSEEKDNELKRVLDAGQYDVYRRQKEEMKDKMKERNKK